MALVAIFDNDVEVAARTGALLLLRQGKAFQTIPIHEVDEVQIHGGADLTTGARNLLLARGIDVIFLTQDGRMRGRLVGQESAWAERRIAQYRVAINEPKRLALAKCVVEGKLTAQTALLAMRNRNLRRDPIAEAILLLRSQLRRCAAAKDLDQLRGIEGQAANIYFSVFGELVTNAAFGWNGRNRRPPRDPLNAVLSFGYTMLCSRVEHALRRAGLDPSLGLLHESIRGNPALALDLAEEFRPMVDGMVLNLVNRKQLGPEDFGPPNLEKLEERDPLADPETFEGAVYLGDVGRKIVTRTWALRTAERSPHPLSGHDYTVNGLFIEQAHQIRRVIEGEAETYRPSMVI